MTTGYCPHCRQDVMTSRGLFNCCLFLILLITAVGWIIYLVIWFAKPEDRCIICVIRIQYFTQVKTRQSNIDPIPSQTTQRTITYQINSIPITPNPQMYINQKTPQTTMNQNKQEIKYCQYCGSEILQDAIFCSACGASIAITK